MRKPRPIATPTLSISPEKVCFFITKAHEFDVADEVVDPDSEASVVDNATFQELTAFINGLTEDEQVDLVALTWLGRGDGGLTDWEDLREEAARLHNNRTAAYLLGKPMLGDYLEEGLAQFGLSCENYRARPDYRPPNFTPEGAAPPRNCPFQRRGLTFAYKYLSL